MFAVLFILERPMLVVEDARVVIVVQLYPLRAQLETDLFVISLWNQLQLNFCHRRSTMHHRRMPNTAIFPLSSATWPPGTGLLEAVLPNNHAQ
ncbi:hypothetical protein TNCV_4538091 [Trichonephila clavipes]|nr:hypothetical protein TNCV_4538091 [Trichonephila clavipes]